jgi:hypothetical protein
MSKLNLPIIRNYNIGELYDRLGLNDCSTPINSYNPSILNDLVNSIGNSIRLSDLKKFIDMEIINYDEKVKTSYNK